MLYRLRDRRVVSAPRRCASAGGIFTKIADIGADLMKNRLQSARRTTPRNPGVIADCTGDNAGDSVGPSADGFETYGVTGVALIVFILNAVVKPEVQVQLLVWIFMMRVMMVLASAASYFINEVLAHGKYADKSDFKLRGAADVFGLAHQHRLGRRDVCGVVRADPQHRRRHEVVVEAEHHHLVRHPRRRDHSRTRQNLYVH